MKSRSLALIALILLLAGTAPAISIRLPVSELTARADVIVTGTVTNLYSHWDEAHRLIYTDVTIAPTSFSKGTQEPSILVRVPGGEVDDIGLAVEDMPVFTIGQRVTLYLSRTSDKVYQLVGGYQGTVTSGGKPYYSYSGYHRSPATYNYYINSSLAAAWFTAIENADAAWNAAGSAFRYNYLGSTSLTGPTQDGNNVICQGNLGSGGTIAANYYWYTRRTKVVTENDIVFNSTLPWSTTSDPNSFDVQDIITHEKGHCLVLNDLYKSYQSEMTMYGYASPGETKKQTLEFGDINGIVAIYGTGFSAPKSEKTVRPGVTK